MTSITYQTQDMLRQKYEDERDRRIAIERQLNNTIIQWENRYGDLYTTLYDENGNIRPAYHKMLFKEDNNTLFRNLKEMGNILSVLKKIRRNRNYKLSTMVKRKYKIHHYMKGQ